MTSIAVFSDIHGNLEALKAIIKDIKRNNFDEVICLGDVIAIGPQPKECLDLIIENNIRLLLGNHELYYIYGTDIDDEISEEKKRHQQWVASQLNNTHKQYLQKCQLEYKCKIGNCNLEFKHFLLNGNNTYPFCETSIIKDGSINEILAHETCDLMFFGHEHKPFTIELKTSKFIDVGSSGCTKNDETFYTILTINDSHCNIEKKEINYDRIAFENIMRQKDYPFKKHIDECFFGIEVQ